MLLLLTSTVLTFNTQVLAEGGSGVGGAVTMAMMSWCNDVVVGLEESSSDALDRITYGNNKVEALRVYYSGLVQAAEQAQNAPVSTANSLTYRTIARGVRLAQSLGVPAVINGEVEGGLAGEQKIQSLVSFFQWYYKYIARVSNTVDQTLYIPYAYHRDYRSSGSEYRTLDLEQKMVEISVNALTELTGSFARVKTARDSYYTTIRTDLYFTALAYLSNEVATDLQESLFAAGLDCQAKRLQSLSRQTQFYLQGRADNKLDAIKLNKFTLELNRITQQLTSRTCER